MIVVQKKGQKRSSYDFTVRKQQVMDALLYKIQHDPYYRDVEVDIHAIDDLPENATDVSDLINSVILPDMDNAMEFATLEGVPGRDDILEGCDTTSFASRPPNAPREIELIRAWANNLNSEVEDPNGKSIDAMNWPTVGSSPINEYNTVGLFDMAFPTLFPKGEADWLQPRMRNVHLHEYAKHLLRYRDNRFGRHARFRYFLLNIIMRHHAQASSAVFVKKNMAELPTTVDELREHLQNLPDSRLADRLMRFGNVLRGTRAYWTKCRAELCDLIQQIGCPTIFFTLSAADMQWPDLHKLMPGTCPIDPAQARKWRRQNVIGNPHIVASYMHLRHTMFQEEIFSKFHNATDYWCRYEWQHRGSPHVHGFLWLKDAPNMDTLNWDDPVQVRFAKEYFDRSVHAFNPRNQHQININVRRDNDDHPCLKDTNQIFQSDPNIDYEELLNCVERHITCNAKSCLRKKGGKMVCRYKAPWELCQTSKLYVDENGEKRYEPR